MQNGKKRLIMLAWSWCVPCSIESVFLHKNGIPFTHVHIPPESPLGSKIPFIIGHEIWVRFVDPHASPGEIHSPVFILADEYPGIFQMSKEEAGEFVAGLRQDEVLIQPTFGELISTLERLGYEVTSEPREAVWAVFAKLQEKANELGLRFKPTELAETEEVKTA